MVGWVRHALLVSVFCTATLLPVCVEAKEFQLGIISDKPVEKKLSGYAPFAKYLARHLKPFGVTDGRVVVAKDLDDMVQRINKGEVDVVLESAFSTIKLSRKTAMKPKLLVWKHGQREYSTVFFVRKESAINKLADLKGKVIALQDPGSTSAFLIPTVELKRAGLQVAPADGKSLPGGVRYVLVEHEKNQAFWVLQKKADAAAFGSDDWKDLTDQQRLGLRVIYTSRPVLRYLASIRSDLPSDLNAAISAVLVGMDRDEEGRKILEGASEIKKIEPLSAEDYRSLEYVRGLMGR